MTVNWVPLLQVAMEEAAIGESEKGVPIGAVLTLNGEILGRGRNRRMQHGDPAAHGEVDAFRAAGRRRSYEGTVMITTLAPCYMCAGLIVQFRIPTAVVGDGEHFRGGIDLMLAHGVEVIELNYAPCILQFARWLSDETNLELILEDGGKSGTSGLLST